MPLFLDEREGVSKEESQETCQYPQFFFDFRVKGQKCSKAIAFIQVCFTPVAKATIMHMRLGTLLVLTCLIITVQAQQDSVVLKTVMIYGLPEAKYLSGSRISALDSALSNIYQSNHLGELLSFQFPVYLRNYGSGMLSGISMRGTSPQHTAVLWNGININSFSLGQSDFSILPVTAFDQVSVHEGAGSSRFGSGAFGGAVLLRTNSENTPLISLQQEIGSFGRFFSSIKGTFRKNKLILSTSLYRLQSKNDFPVPQTGERQQHAAYLQEGFLQHIRYDFTNAKSLQLDYWFHGADREIQPTIGNVNTYNEQQDRNNRVSVSYRQNNRFGLLKGGIGFVNDEIVYNGNESDVLRWITFINHQYSFRNHWNIQSGVDWNHIIGKIKEYGHEPVEDRVDVFLSAQRTWKKLNFSVNLRQPFITGIQTPLLPYIGVDFQIFKTPSQTLTGSVNASKNFRAPTLNDRYWQDLGREDLLPETSYSVESGLKWQHTFFKAEATAFYQLVDEWILWSPGSDVNYQPGNIKKVEAKGIELSSEWLWSTGSWKKSIRGSYQYTSSTTKEATPAEAASIGKQLIYTPLHTGAITVVSRFQKWSANIFCQFSGIRFTEVSNSNLYALDPYFLTDISISRIFRKSQHEFCFQFLVKNILNTVYQQYSAHAMPGRSYNFSIRYQLNYKSK